MKIFFAWLEVEQQVPHFTTIRNWLQRLGVAALQEPLEPADDWIWMVDHSNQIGQEKILVVLGVRASRLPPDKPLQLPDMRVLAVRPGKSWKREDVARVYTELAAEFGAPRQVLSDGAVELRESVAALQALRPDCIALQDFKHKAANFLEQLLKETESFAQFTGQVGSTRAAVQQTELAFLTPPPLKTKARFMNLGTLLNWSQMVLTYLTNPQATTRQWATPERLEAKLGWLRGFAAELPAWNECQQVIERGLEFINRQGVFRGAADQLRQLLKAPLQHSLSRDLAERLAGFVQAAEAQLKEQERLPLSTEILESAFGRYKRLEGQHAKGGFTSLIAGFAGLLQDPTPQSVRRMFSQVSTQDVKQWLRQHLDTTVAAQRAATYREMKSLNSPAEKRPA
jgi:hypothetical protein